MLGVLHEMLANDPDAQVAANCITVLDKVSWNKGISMTSETKSIARIRLYQAVAWNWLESCM